MKPHQWQFLEACERFYEGDDEPRPVRKKAGLSSCTARDLADALTDRAERRRRIPFLRDTVGRRVPPAQRRRPARVIPPPAIVPPPGPPDTRVWALPPAPADVPAPTPALAPGPVKVLTFRVVPPAEVDRYRRGLD